MATVWALALVHASILLSTIVESQLARFAEPGCSANYGYIQMQSTFSTIPAQSIISERVHYYPYIYNQTIPQTKVVPFGDTHTVSMAFNNPCDISTWTIPASFYSNNIVVIEYNEDFAYCSPQKWTLNLQTYGNVAAVLVANNLGTTEVYSLFGDSAVPNPSIPTRMISKNDYTKIQNLWSTTDEDLFVAIDCFDTTSPPTVCLVDDSLGGNHVELDGEFHEQAFKVNGHPVWYKPAMSDLGFADHYIWLKIDSSWRWVIGNDYNNDLSIIAECRNTLHIALLNSDPALCGNNWYDLNGKHLGNISTNADTSSCDISDNHLCIVSSSVPSMQAYGGRYRQIHDGTPLWISQTAVQSSKISVVQNFNDNGNLQFQGYTYVITDLSTNSPVAACWFSIQTPTKPEQLNPEVCGGWYSKDTSTNTWIHDVSFMMDNCRHPAVPTTLSPTEQGCSSNYAFVYVETALGTFKQTATSFRVDFAPYSYPYNIIKRQLVQFADGRAMTITANNPCDTKTWTLAPSFYDGKIVMIDYDITFNELCSVQQWTLNLETYANVIAVLIANDLGFSHVYALPGDVNAANPTIPTRMISETSAHNIKMQMRLNTTEKDVFVSIDCFDKSLPSMICVLDTSNIGNHVMLDGEFQALSNVEINGHSVWMKEGMNMVWSDYYIWLTVDHSDTTYNPWRWVMGTDYNDDTSVIARCLSPTGVQVTDPTQCGPNWYYMDNTLVSNLTSTAGICDLADNYICSSSGSGFFNAYFAGRYRQIHDGVPVWFADRIGEHSLTNELKGEAFLGVSTVNESFAQGLAFIFAYAQSGNIYAFCPIADGYTKQDLLEPWKCNENWYTVAEFSAGMSWMNDPLMDVDQCAHPNGTVTVTQSPITYPTKLCVMDPSYQYSKYQSYYGIYVLDSNLKYDERNVYRNQRLKDGSDEWNIIWYEEKDSWVINDGIPDVTYVSQFEAICREQVNTPDLCNECWEFYIGTQKEINCGVKVFPIDSLNENDCLVQPTNNVVHYTQEATLCFDDGKLNTFQYPLTGKWILETRSTYRNRAYWYKLDASTGQPEYYMYYDDVWRFWVIDTTFSTQQEQFQLYCLNWYEFEPMNCQQWYDQNGDIVSMNNQCTLNPTDSPTPNPTLKPTLQPTNPPTADCSEHNKYVYAESSYLAHTLTSAVMNFPPYVSGTFYQKKLVLFENGRNYTKTMSNPCEPHTWQADTAMYQDAVVLIKYTPLFAELCTVQHWILGLEFYGAVAVLIANDNGLDHVYSLSGHDSMLTTIPTRMISQLAGVELTHAILDYNDEVFISFGCFDDTMDYPSIICLSDQSTFGQHVYLDGEYQRQGPLEVNDHPVYYKMGHYGVFKDLYIFLDVDRSKSGHHSWRWVIGTDYYDASTVFAECNVNNGQHIAHPALCGNNWKIQNVSAPTITTQNETCAVSDNYICVESSPGAWFESWFDGRYRQIHEGTALWLLQDAYIDAYITVGTIYMPSMFAGTPWAFLLMVNQTDIWAFCIIGDGFTMPTIGESLEPWTCNRDWYVYGVIGNQYQWYIDLAFDIDTCTHLNSTVTEAPITYPQYLCIADPTNKYSHYQSKYGVYVLDQAQTYDGRNVYYNQRLHGKYHEWYMLWFEEKDSWVINEMVPDLTVVHDTDGICREDVATPDLCNECWEFYQGFTTEINCDIEVTVMTTNNEADCMVLPSTSDQSAITSINLCFDDGVQKHWDNAYTGKWYRETRTLYNGRSYWYKLASNGYVAFYMYYDENWRFWVIDRNLGNKEVDDWHFYCLKWDELTPFNCDTWYSTIENYKATLSMNSQNCQSEAPTLSPSPMPTAMTSAPTKYPTQSCNARNSFIYAEWSYPGLAPRTIISEEVNFAPYVYDTFTKQSMVLFEDGRNATFDISNPCDVNTWLEDPSYYDDKVVLIEYSDLCNPEEWTLNLESYANVIAVIVSNPVDLTHVYQLAGDESLADPVIPTRMVSQFSGILLEYVDRDLDSEVLISFGCFDDVNGIEYPSIICLVDTSIWGQHVYLDGEYQRQSEMFVNDHPVWLKDGYEGLWKEIYLFLKVDQNVNGQKAWKWVIGLDPLNEAGILAECRLNTTTGEIPNHPALCGNNWYIDDQLIDTITTSDTICELGDNYVCVDAAPGGLFDFYFTGQYRQIHQGVPLWLHADGYNDIYITVGAVAFPSIGITEQQWAYAFVINQTQIWAFCIIENQMDLTNEDLLSPHKCNRDWYVMEWDFDNQQYQWVIDYAMDIDQCTHPDISTTALTIEYPQTLCLNDETNAQSPYQSHYGVYQLDTEQSFDGRYVYYNQRLKNQNAEWYIIWYEEKDAWVINQYVPPYWSTVVRDHEGICREDVLTPDLCTECWEFYYFNGLQSKPNCNVKLERAYSDLESDCVSFPRQKKSADQLIKEITVGFHDAKTMMEQHPLSGKWKMEPETYGGRAYWKKVRNHHHTTGNRRLLQTGPPETTDAAPGELYMFYNDIWRYWVINHMLRDTEVMVYCLDWRSFEPWNCTEWHSFNGTITMDLSFSLPSTTAADVTSENTQSSVIDVSGAADSGNNSKSKSMLSADSWAMWWVIGGVGLCCTLMCCMLCLWRRRSRKRNLEGGRGRISMDSVSLDKDEEPFDLVSMHFGTSHFKGEHIDMTEVRHDGKLRKSGDTPSGSTPDGGNGSTPPTGTSLDGKHSSSTSDQTPLYNREEEDLMQTTKRRESITLPPGNDDDNGSIVLHESDDENEDQVGGTGGRKQTWVKFDE